MESLSAPMENKFLKALVLKNKQHAVGALLLFVCLLWFAVTSGLAQSVNLKRITGLQSTETAEGSRVTIVSDSALIDYEAFRRGDRFYVKIPLADFKSAPPRCCASGFENVQVQKVGDSVIVSFKLQPGATARVDQRSNRLDVIFSAPNRILRNPANAGSNRGATGTRELGTSQARGIDAAGPLPPGSISAIRQKALTEGERVANQSRPPQNPGSQPSARSNTNTGPNNQSLSGNNQAGTATNQSTTGSVASQSPSPAPASSSILTPSTSSNYPSSTSATPAAAGVSNPAVGSTTASGPSGSPGLASSWRTRSKAALQWVLANRLATLLGALILLSLALYLVAAFRRRKKSIAAKRVSKVQPKVQPHSLEEEFDELLARGPATLPASSNASHEFVKNPATTPAVVVVTPPNRSRVLAKPSIASPPAGPERSSDEGEREVFEL